jgi:hypothetical protein
MFELRLVRGKVKGKDVLEFRRVEKVIEDIHHPHWWSRPQIKRTHVWSEWQSVPIVELMVKREKK